MRVPLPTYPFVKKRFYLPPIKLLGASFSSVESFEKHELVHRKTDYLPPKNNIEKHLIALWEKSLKTAGIGANDDFFLLGGDSLLALEITDSVQHLYHIEVNLQHLFDNPTVASFADLIRLEIIGKIDQFSDE